MSAEFWISFGIGVALIVLVWVILVLTTRKDR